MSRRMSIKLISACLSVFALSSWAMGDETLHRYEGDVFPEAAGWEIFNPCENVCSRSIQDGHFVLLWSEAQDSAVYNLRIRLDPEPFLPSLWVEWRFRSNHPIGPNFFSCDAAFSFQYVNVSNDIDMYGDAAITDGGSTFINGYDIDEFHTFRFESLDGTNFTIALDGEVWKTGIDLSPTPSDKIQFRGGGAASPISSPT